MFDIHNYSSFIMAIVIFQLIPGAGTIAILNATAKGGVMGGMRAVAGTLTGDFLYMSAAVLGLAAILSASPKILAAMQWLGVTYLCWIGLKTIYSSLSIADKSDGKPELQGWNYYRQALAVGLTNPKVIMFFMAFFPLFLKPESKSMTLVLLMVHVTVISLLYQTVLVFAGNMAAKWLSRWQPARVIAHRLAGFALIGFGVKLAASIK